MRKLAVPIVFIVGIIFIVSSLLYELHHGNVVQKVLLETFTVEESPIDLNESLDEVGDLPVPLESNSLPQLANSTESFIEPDLYDMQEIFGYLAYETNISENIEKLEELVPSLINENGSVVDVIDNPTASIVNRLLNENGLTLYAVNKKVEPYSCTLYLTDGTNVHTIETVDGFKFMSTLVVEDQVLILCNADGTYCLLVVDVGDGIPVVMDKLISSEFITLGSTISEGVIIGNTSYLPHILNNKLEFIEKGEGESHDDLGS